MNVSCLLSYIIFRPQNQQAVYFPSVLTDKQAEVERIKYLVQGLTVV